MEMERVHLIMGKNEMQRTIRRLSLELVERMGGMEGLFLIGIQKGGVNMAERIREELEKMEGGAPPAGALDITMYRDDVGSSITGHILRETVIPFDMDGKRIVLIDDVINTGRTVRAALDALIDFGRPSLIRLLVLIDRGGREFPIRPDFVGKFVETRKDEIIKVYFKERDGRDQVILKMRE